MSRSYKKNLHYNITFHRDLHRIKQLSNKSIRRKIKRMDKSSHLAPSDFKKLSNIYTRYDVVRLYASKREEKTNNIYKKLARK